MSTFNQASINRLNKEIADLQKSDAREASKEANLVAKVNKAEAAANKANTASTLQNKLREAERGLKDLAAVRKKRADISSKIADRSKKLGDCQQKKLKADQSAQQKLAAEQKRMLAERDRFQMQAIQETRRQSQSAVAVQYDFFVSHASEDKEGFVRELVKALEARGANIWYDEFTLKVGDSLRQCIDRGLANSRFGIVVFSEHFFKKEWTAKELNGLVTLEIQGQTRILPIWHKVSKDEVARYSPMIADKVALNTSLESVDEIASKLVELLS